MDQEPQVWFAEGPEGVYGMYVRLKNGETQFFGFTNAGIEDFINDAQTVRNKIRAYNETHKLPRASRRKYPIIGG